MTLIIIVVDPSISFYNIFGNSLLYSDKAGEKNCNVHQSGNCLSRFRLQWSRCRLISRWPGLPKDAVACLIRVLRFYNRKLEFFCKGWYHHLAGNFFCSVWRRLGMAEDWVHDIRQDRDGQISWHAFAPRYVILNISWSPLYVMWSLIVLNYDYVGDEI